MTNARWIGIRCDHCGIEDEANPRAVELVPPTFEALDHRGTGDSMFAATGVGLARGMDMIAALRLGTAAGALNATRRGLGSGTREEIERLAAHVVVKPVSGGDSPPTIAVATRKLAS
jgi:sugar/nucleoside kinase (ribokinase family)